MKKQTVVLVILTFIVMNGHAQIEFEKGYFVNNANQKTECLIKNNDWKDNPTNFKYTLSPDEEIKNAEIGDVLEFGIYNNSKYIRALVKIDRSGDDLVFMSRDKNPVYNEELLFLKVMLEGKASLYQYREERLLRFFYRMNDSAIQQLVYKPYLVNKYAKAVNNYYHHQLFFDLKCEGVTMKEIERVGYNKKDLNRFFVQYNECNSSPPVSYEFKQKKDIYTLTIRPGLNISNLSLQNSGLESWNTVFDPQAGFRFGLESEIVFPFNKNKWAAIFEPTFQYFKSAKTAEADYISGGKLTRSVDYKSIEVPVGCRYYIFLKNGSRIFINGSVVFDFSYNSTIKFTRTDAPAQTIFDIRSSTNLAFGLGYKFMDRYSVEMRYMTNREIISALSWRSFYNTFSVIFGFSLF